MAHQHRADAWLLLLAALATAPAALARVPPLGSEFQVNTHTTAQHHEATVAAAADGDFVVAWVASDLDGDSAGVFGRRFSSAGTALAAEFQVNDHTPDKQRRPLVATSAAGDFVVVWESYDQDGAGIGIFAHRFSSAGASLATEFQVNTRTPDNQRTPSVAAAPDGAFVVVWSGNGQDGSAGGIFSRRFSSAGIALAAEFQVNTVTSYDQEFPVVAAESNGDFVVVWFSYLQDGDDWGVFGRRFSSAGTPLATEFQVSTYTSEAQRDPVVAADADGDFVVAWESKEQDGAHYGIFARRFSSTGAALASELQVNLHTAGEQSYPAVATDAGRFLVTWRSVGQDGSAVGVFARAFSSTGASLAAELQVNTFTSSNQQNPAATANAGRYVVAWDSHNQADVTNYSIFAQRYSVLSILDIDGNGAAAPLTDGLLALRYLFDFTGNTLTNGAVDAQNCERCDSAAIEGYVTSILAQLDIDDDGEAAPLTDGLLILRFLFGFTGSTLTNGAVDTQNCNRCSAAVILPYLQSLI